MPTGSNSIDWDTVWKSLDWDDDDRHQASERERLRLRARQYAAASRDRAEPVGDSRSVLTFDLGKEQYGVDVMLVRGVRTVSRIARVPGVPRFYQGVINVRGRIITVMDLRYFFDIAVTDEVASPTELVIVRSNHLEIGLLAHQVNEVVSIPLMDIKPIEHMPYMLGMTGSRIVVLNIVQLFDDERLIVGGLNTGGQQNDD
ncbi:MAG: purine-binding chemotaxis protein CheW [Chloroflexi bacterium]|nr:purine-binding chemotaxis protein CheW [Chloroflexota bacterium]